MVKNHKESKTYYLLSDNTQVALSTIYYKTTTLCTHKHRIFKKSTKTCIIYNTLELSTTQHFLDNIDNAKSRPTTAIYTTQTCSPLITKRKHAHVTTNSPIRYISSVIHGRQIYNGVSRNSRSIEV